MKLKDAPFAHGRVHAVSTAVQVVSSYHTSRYNVQTGILSQAMFDDVIRRIALIQQECG